MTIREWSERMRTVTKANRFTIALTHWWNVSRGLWAERQNPNMNERFEELIEIKMF